MIHSCPVEESTGPEAGKPPGPRPWQVAQGWSSIAGSILEQPQLCVLSSSRLPRTPGGLPILLACHSSLPVTRHHPARAGLRLLLRVVGEGKGGPSMLSSILKSLYLGLSPFIPPALRLFLTGILSALWEALRSPRVTKWIKHSPSFKLLSV